MTGGLTGWLDSPRQGHGIYLAGDGDEWELQDFRDLADLSLRIAAQLADAGVRRDDVVCLVQPTGSLFIASLFGTWAAGATVCPIPPPSPLGAPDAYPRHVGEILRAARPRLVLTTEALAASVAQACGLAEMSRPPVVGSPAARPAATIPEPAEIALLQFTSGSTGRPRGVQVTRSNLQANIEMISAWLDWGPDDGITSWLPLHHDMGLIGCLLTPVSAQRDIWLMRPEQFIQDPLRWLACLGDGRAMATSAPTFGYAYTARRVDPGRLAGLNFAGWRTAIVGAERVDAAALRAFARLLAGHGFTHGTFRPAYGLAEATLAVTGTRGQIPNVVRPNWSLLSFGEPVLVEAQAPLAALDTHDSTSAPGWLVGCGTALEGVSVSIRDASGRPLPEGTFGEIAVTGSTIARGYRGGDPVGSTRFAKGTLFSGDAGFMLDGELYVVGRMADSLKVRGKNIYVEDLETKVAAAARIPNGRCAAISSQHSGGVSVILLAEVKAGAWVDVAAEALQLQLGDETEIRIITGPRGLIRRGSSGKPRRRHMWQELHAGRLGGSVAYHVAPRGDPSYTRTGQAGNGA